MSPSGSLTKTILRLTGENPGCARQGIDLAFPYVGPENPGQARQPAYHVSLTPRINAKTLCMLERVLTVK